MKLTPLLLANIVLSTILLSSMFYVGVTTSIRQYDPYADYDSDGDVDIFDVVSIANVYGTNGDPTRNITIARHASKRYVLAEGEYIEAGTSWFGEVEVDGYAKVSVMCWKQSNTGGVWRMYFAGLNATKYWQVDANGNDWHLGNYDVMNEKLRVDLREPAISTTFWVEVYLLA